MQTQTILQKYLHIPVHNLSNLMNPLSWFFLFNKKIVMWKVWKRIWLHFFLFNWLHIISPTPLSFCLICGQAKKAWVSTLLVSLGDETTQAPAFMLDISPWPSLHRHQCPFFAFSRHLRPIWRTTLHPSETLIMWTINIFIPSCYVWCH